MGAYAVANAQQLAWIAVTVVWFSWFAMRRTWSVDVPALPSVPRDIVLNARVSRYSYMAEAHCIPVLVLSLLSIYEIAPEWMSIIYSGGYMAIDALFMMCVTVRHTYTSFRSQRAPNAQACTTRLSLCRYRLLKGAPWSGQQWVYVLHHVCVLPMYFHPWSGPGILYHPLKVSSRLLLIEGSVPFMYRWERSGKYSDFVVAWIAFVVCRIVYLFWLLFVFLEYRGPHWYIGVLLYISQFTVWFIPQTPRLIRARYSYVPPPGTAQDFGEVLFFFRPPSPRQKDRLPRLLT